MAAVRATHGGRGLALGFAVVPSAKAVLDVLRETARSSRGSDHSNRAAEAFELKCALPIPRSCCADCSMPGHRVERYELRGTCPLHQIFFLDTRRIPLD